MNTSKVINELMSRGLSQTEIAKRACCSVSQISRLYGGLRGARPGRKGKNIDRRLRQMLQRMRTAAGVKRAVPGLVR